MLRTLLLCVPLAACGMAPPPDPCQAWVERVLADDDGLPLLLGSGQAQRLDLPAFLTELWRLGRNDVGARPRALRAMTAFPTAAAPLRGDVLAALKTWSAYDADAACVAAAECLEIGWPRASLAELEHARGELQEFVLAHDEETVATLAVLRALVDADLEVAFRRGTPLRQLLREALLSDHSEQLLVAGHRLLLQPGLVDELARLDTAWAADPQLAACIGDELQRMRDIGPLVLAYGSPWCMRMQLMRQWCPDAACARFGRLAAVFATEAWRRQRAARELLAGGQLDDPQLMTLLAIGARELQDDVRAILRHRAETPGPPDPQQAWVERVLADDDGLALFMGSGRSTQTDLPAFLASLWRQSEGMPQARLRALRARLAFPAADFGRVGR